MSTPAESESGANRQGDPQFMTSLARGLLVIRAFSGLRRERTIADVSRVTGLSRAAARRCLYTLCELGYASCNGRRYRLLPKVLALGHGAIPAAGIAQCAAAHPPAPRPSD
ncbi:MAG: helix-turn-helix domain-containing protein [Gammaproteobacteria bacterium]|nr:helix-turn-helix domain-containing protein [Gammaproteobacteria bacterium]